MASKVLDNKKYDILDALVEDIYTKCVKMDKEETKALRGRFESVITLFIDTMLEVDPLFDRIYNRIFYTGSYYEGLRVGHATEFDLNLVLKPKIDLKLILEKDKRQCPPGYVEIEVEGTFSKEYVKWIVVEEELWNVSRTLLVPDKVCAWLQGVVQKAYTKLKSDDYLNDFEIYVFKSGPAWTLQITFKEEQMKSISIDLVPVLEFPSYLWPVSFPNGNWLPWFVVPKPARFGRYTYGWRMSFPLQESEVLNDLKFMKYTIRLLKRVRDQFQFNLISSYYIKTLFLWEVKNEEPMIWNCRRGRLFIHMLHRLKDAMEAKKIPFYWDADCNLIEHVSFDTLSNFSGCLKRFLKKIDFLIDTNKGEELDEFFISSLSTEKENIEDKENQTSYSVLASCTIL